MQFPSWLTWYKKPEYRDIKEYANALSSGRRSISPVRSKTTIPSRLSLERVLQNKTCSPMSLYDFHMYLKYIEFSAENLEFYIWFRNYKAIWDKTASTETFDEKDAKSFQSFSESTDTIVDDSEADPEAAAAAKDHSVRFSSLISKESACSGGVCTIKPKQPQRLAKAYLDACTIPNDGASLLHPGYPVPDRRAEIDAVIETFLQPGSEKELNIPPVMRERALNGLRHISLDPAHLQPVADHVYQLLHNCSHRNFVRLGVSNGTFETVCVATSLGIVLTLAGFLCVFLRAFTPYMGAHSRFDVFAAWPMWWLGLSLILSGLRGSCFFLLLFTRRQPLPWERFDDNASVALARTGIWKILSRLMIFDRKFKVNDAHLRRLQHKIVWQSLMGGALFATFGVLLFIFLPIWSQTVRT